jgi:hypothetical protein
LLFFPQKKAIWVASRNRVSCCSVKALQLVGVLHLKGKELGRQGSAVASTTAQGQDISEVWMDMLWTGLWVVVP